jgi:hypothetical protein
MSPSNKLCAFSMTRFLYLVFYLVLSFSIDLFVSVSPTFYVFLLFFCFVNFPVRFRSFIVSSCPYTLYKSITSISFI